jgi:uncharacterized protein involved in tellurium resistance
VFCPVLEFKEEKRTFAKIEGDNMDFFQKEKKKIKNGVLGFSFVHGGDMHLHEGSLPLML